MSQITRRSMGLVLVAGVAGSVKAGSEKGLEPTRAHRNRSVLVELFTSEGCSSCPPADNLLEQLDRLQPVAGVDLIVLSEHVDYWNYIGWTDPYSSPLFSRRQQDYARRFSLSGVYTPQMIVDGSRQFVGNDSRAASDAIAAAASLEKIEVRLSRAASGIHLEVEPLPAAAGRHKADVHLALVQNDGTSEVVRGENKGRRLRHVAIVRRLEQVAVVTIHEGIAKDLPVEIARGMRAVAFVQDSATGRVWGAAALSA